jgi:hypothetical protein
MLTAAAVFAALFSHFGSVKTVDPPESFGTPTPTPKTDPKTVLEEQVNAADVESMTINTQYKNFFASGDKCRKTYNEYFGNDDGAWSKGSPCTVNLTVKRDGSAEKTIGIRRYDRAAKQWGEVEKTVWKAKLPEAEFKNLAELIVHNEAFKQWNDGISLYTSNCKIIVRHKNGTKSPMSNVDERTTAYLPMVDAFKALDANAAWEKVE